MLPLIFLLSEEVAKSDYNTLSFLVLRFITFIFVFFIIIGAAYLTSKYISNKNIFFMNQKNLKIVERLSLGIDKSIYLINLDSQYYILSSTKTNIELIDKFDKEGFNIIEHIDSNNNASINFKNYFDKYIQSKNVFKKSEIDPKPLNIDLTSKLIEIQKRNLEVKEGLKEEEDRTKTNEKRS